MEKGGHGLSKVSPGPAMPYPSTPCRLATPETALWPFQWWPAPQGGRPAAVFYPFGYPTPYAYDRQDDVGQKGGTNAENREEVKVEALSIFRRRQWEGAEGRPGREKLRNCRRGKGKEPSAGPYFRGGGGGPAGRGRILQGPPPP
jgi:hypothetical protein